MSIARRLGAAALVAFLVTATVACTDGGDTATSTTNAAPNNSTTTVPRGEEPADTCDQEPTVDGVVAEPVEGRDADFTVTSHDGTKLRVHWYPVTGAAADSPAPTVLKGPGWALGGDTNLDPEQPVLLGGASIPALHDSGYNVLTWDPRGFGKSEGVVQINHAETEGRDVQVLLDWLATQPEVQLDRPGDPRVGMVGHSYGGGIQLVTAAIDCRVDVIVPGIAWNSLVSSLYKNETAKVGWAEFLTNAGDAGGELDPHIHSSAADAPSGMLGDDDVAWFDERGPAHLIEQITIPTLFVQGTVDTLFTLDEAVANHRTLVDQGVPTAMVWFCGGHGVCSSHASDSSLADQATFDWLARYLKGDDSVEVVSGITFVDQNGEWWHIDGLDLADGTVSETGSGLLDLINEGGAGPLAPLQADDMLSGLVESFTTASAENAVEVVIESTDEVMALGAPKLTLTYSGTVAEGPGITRVFAQLIDGETGLVLGDQITPIAVTLDGENHTTEVDLEIVAHHLAPGATIRLQLVATTVAYATPMLGGSITFESVEITVPTTAKATAVG